MRPPTFEFYWPYLRNHLLDLNHTFTTQSQGVQVSTPRDSSKSDKRKGSFSVSAPSAFIRQNTVYVCHPILFLFQKMLHWGQACSHNLILSHAISACESSPVHYRFSVTNPCKIRLQTQAHIVTHVDTVISILPDTITHSNTTAG